MIEANYFELLKEFEESYQDDPSMMADQVEGEFGDNVIVMTTKFPARPGEEPEISRGVWFGNFEYAGDGKMLRANIFHEYQMSRDSYGLQGSVLDFGEEGYLVSNMLTVEEDQALADYIEDNVQILEVHAFDGDENYLGRGRAAFAEDRVSKYYQDDWYLDPFGNNFVDSGYNGSEAPVDLVISATSFDENIEAGAVVGTFSTADPDVGDAFSYSLVDGVGDSDNALFLIDGDQLKIINSPDFESKSSYSIRLETKDSGSLTLEKSFTLTVNDLPESATQNIEFWVSAGSFESPYYRFYADAEGSQELTAPVLDTSKSYTFRRLNEATSHPFFISDSGFKQSSSDALIITGDGSPFQGITGDESFKVEFTDLVATTEELLYYCSSHSSMQRTLDLIDGSTQTFQVTDVRQIASGLALKLSEVPDLEKLNLYDGTDASIDLPDLQLTRSDGAAVENLSVHWKEESSELYVIQTDSLTGISKNQFSAGESPFQSDLLAEGDYTLIIDARSDGLISASSGELIDGNGDGITGDSFAYYFTKTTSENVISIGDTTRGSGQSLGLNGIAHSNGINGLPVLVSTTAEIRSISGNVSYDATAFDNASLVVGHDLPDDWTLDTQENDVGSLNYTASGTTAITGTDQELFRFDAVVSEDAAYGSSTLIEATIETPEDPDLNFESDPSLVVLAYSGDTTGNGSHSSLDASRIQRVVVGLDSGFDSYDTLAPTLIGDTTGNGGLSSLDASRVQQEVVGLFVDTFPEIPSI